jgi:hypothetical protein
LHAAEEGLKRAVHPQHHILQHLAVHFGVLRHRLLDAGQLGFLLVVGEGNAPQAPRFVSLAHRRVVDMTAEHQGALKQPLLFQRRLEFVFVGFANGLRLQLSLTSSFCLAGTNAATAGTSGLSWPWWAAQGSSAWINPCG